MALHLTAHPAASTPKTLMEVSTTPDLQAKLNHLATVQGRNMESLVQEAIERLVDYDEWFIREVEKGITQIERGQVLTHEEVGSRLEKLLAAKQLRG
jgi:predicted transcriptional regulator